MSFKHSCANNLTSTYTSINYSLYKNYQFKFVATFTREVITSQIGTYQKLPAEFFILNIYRKD